MPGACRPGAGAGAADAAPVHRRSRSPAASHPRADSFISVSPTGSAIRPCRPPGRRKVLAHAGIRPMGPTDAEAGCAAHTARRPPATGAPAVRQDPRSHGRRRHFQIRASLQGQQRVNERIRIPQVRVIGDDGSQVGILTTREAIAMAQAKGLDLVEVAPTARPPVCKIMDYGKFKYETELGRRKAARRSSTRCSSRKSRCVRRSRTTTTTSS